MLPPVRATVRTVALLVLCGPVLAGCIFGFGLLPYSTPSKSPVSSLLAVSPSPGPTAQPMPLVRGESLPGAPVAAVWNIAGDRSIQISAWQSGKPLRNILNVPRLQPDRGSREDVRVSAAPTGRFFAVTEVVTSGTATVDDFRVISATGALLFSRRLGIQEATIRWSPDGSRLVINAGLAWLVITLKEGRPPAVQEIVTSRPRQPDGRVLSPWMLIGFSEDGRWIYGADQTGGTPWFRPAVRVAAAGGPIQSIKRLPTTKGARLPFPPTFGNPRIEPVIDSPSGSVVTWVCTVSDTCRVNVWRDRTAVVFDLPTGATNLDLAWNGGSLIGLWTQKLSREGTIRVSRFDAASRPGVERRITTLPASPGGGSLVGLTPGFVLVGLGSGVPGARMELVLVRLSDGARSVAQSAVGSPGVELFSFAGWLPATR